MSTRKEEIKDELMEMFYSIITGDMPNRLQDAEKVTAQWNTFIRQVQEGFKYWNKEVDDQ